MEPIRGDRVLDQDGQKALIPGYSRVFAIFVALTGWAFLAGGLSSWTRSRNAADLGVSQVSMVATAAIAVALLAVLLDRILRRHLTPISTLAGLQADYLDSLSTRRVSTYIFGYAALSLFLELAVIRWQTSAISILAFYKNFSLLSAFAGLGLGYALFRRRQTPVFAVIPILGLQLFTFWVLRTPRFAQTLEAVGLNPFAEQTTMGVRQAGEPIELMTVYLTLASVFIGTALAFLPIGQCIGRLMGRTSNLRSYGLNLLGSLFGVGVIYLFSAAWLPPALWFGIAFLALMPLYVYNRRLARALALTGIGVVILSAVPPDPSTENIYSPYQLIEADRDESGEMNIRSAGHFLLTATNLAGEAIEGDRERQHLADFYEFPFKVAESLDRILIVGAGAGNDVAAALRQGARHVDAVEIDPAIAHLGMEHPENPFRSPRVTVHVDDARSFLASTSASYDLIVYGLLDSHSVVSHGSSVRMDSYVYTVEGLRLARDRLAPNGVLSLAFLAFDLDLTDKLHGMLNASFNGIDPSVVSVSPSTLIFLHGRQGPPHVDEALLRSAGFDDVSEAARALARDTDLATDDWPFLYIAKRTFPLSYLGMGALVLAMGGLMVRSFAAGGLDVGNAGFFFLGAGFLLVETKGITELGVTFGNTWQVVGIVIIAVLMMGFFANLVVTNRPQISMRLVISLLMLSLLVGYIMSALGITGSTNGAKWLALFALTLPVFFSGLAFSRGLTVASSVSGALAANIMGAIVGGLLEYSAMLLGFRSLYALSGLMFAIGGYFLVGSMRSDTMRPPALHEAARVKL